MTSVFNARGTSLHLCVNTAPPPPASSAALQLTVPRSVINTMTEAVLWGPLETSLMTGCDYCNDCDITLVATGLTGSGF